MWIVIAGTCLEDADARGPFESSLAAHEYAESHFGEYDHPDIDWEVLEATK